jgi:hypothetical protein
LALVEAAAQVVAVVAVRVAVAQVYQPLGT